MKNIVRAFVLTLALTGMFATANTNNASAKATTLSKTSAMPVPTCAPGDPNGCGILDW